MREPVSILDSWVQIVSLRMTNQITKTIDFLHTVTAESLAGAEDIVVSFPAGPERVLKLKGRDFLYQWVMPNLYFHTTTAYNILRHNGVDVGKMDYLKGADLLS